MKKIIIGNWKMNPVAFKEAQKIFDAIAKGLPRLKQTEVVLCPPYVYLPGLKGKSKKFALGAQDVFWMDKGAFTGEISSMMLSQFGVQYVILGHSERRAMGESNSDVNRKVKAVLASKMTPVVCVGEAVRNEDHSYLTYVQNQIEECLVGISKNLVQKIIIAYEPIWAIGKDAVRPATGEEYREMSILIRKVLSDKFGKKAADGIRIIYGGSVHPENAKEFLEVGQTDGFLPGRDSLDPKKFIEIVNTCEASKS